MALNHKPAVFTLEGFEVSRVVLQYEIRIALHLFLVLLSSSANPTVHKRIWIFF